MEQPSTTSRSFSFLTFTSVVLVTIYPLLPSHYDPADAAKARLDALRTALEYFRADTGAYPDASYGLEALARCPKGVTNWHGPYLDMPDVTLNSRNHRYTYVSPSSEHPARIIFSPGPVGRLGGADDISIQLP